MIMQVKTIHPLFQHQNIDIALFVNEKMFLFPYLPWIIKT